MSKPIQYVGGELNSQVKDWDVAGDETVRWALMYPDAYEVGLPNQGVMILYEVLNERPDALAERTYAVWPDMEALMREHGVPQFTVDAHRPVGAFDLLGVSFSTELGYTNLLTALDLAGIPLRPATATTTHPIVIAGGHAAFNPEPVADFVDAAVLGDGEQAVLEITDVVREWKARGPPGRPRGAAAAPGRAPAASTCRASTTSTTCPTAGSSASCPNRPGVPWRVASTPSWTSTRGRTRSSRWCPLAETVHERMQRRDLPRLHPGLPVLPGRHDHPAGARAQHRQAIGAMVEKGLAATGFEEVGLLSLSSADHSEIARDRQAARRPLRGHQRSGLSLPSTRVDAFNVDLANELSRNGRRSGLTFAPEGGSERIRKVINKMVTEDDLIRTVATAYGNGWRQVKLYFMCGLPTETDEDVLQIAELAKRVIEVGREVTGSRDIRCTVSHRRASCPKPHTPFQWAAQLDHETTDARLAKLRDAIRADRQYGRAIGFRYHDGKPGIVEGLLSRGDRRVGPVIRAGLGGRRPLRRLERALLLRPLDACADEALAGEPVDVDWYTTRERDVRRGAALGPPRLRPRQGLALGGLAGRPRRGRGRGLPLDPVLRLRRLPADGHRDPDRARPASSLLPLTVVKSDAVTTGA